MMSFNSEHKIFFILAIILNLTFFNELTNCDKFEEENYGVKYASNCEVCKILTAELNAKLDETGKVGGLLETGYHLDKRLEEKKEYKKSQLRLIESIEGACEGILRYNIHKERKDSTRFSKGQSQTFSALHGLVAKGVKVDLGIPYELWDKPSAEITHLKTQCDDMMEKYESDIEDWYNEKQEEITLVNYLCRKVILKDEDSKCLNEVYVPEENPDPKPKNKGEKTEL